MPFKIDKHGYFSRKRFDDEQAAVLAAKRFIGAASAVRRRADGSLTVFSIDDQGVLKPEELHVRPE